MGISGFNIIAQNSGNAGPEVKWLTTDVLFDADTPEKFLREIHVQFDTIQSVVLEITLDGTTFMKLNNGNAIIGLATFTFFVIKNSMLNFRTQLGADDVDFAIVVTGV